MQFVCSSTVTKDVSESFGKEDQVYILGTDTRHIESTAHMYHNVVREGHEDIAMRNRIYCGRKSGWRTHLITDSSSGRARLLVPTVAVLNFAFGCACQSCA